MATQLPNNPYTQPRQPLSNRPLQDDDDNGQHALENVQNIYEKNKKVINGVIAVLFIVVGGWAAYQYLYLAPREQKASARAFYATQFFMQDSSAKALQGDAQHWGLNKIIKEYGGTKTANLAHYQAGICYLKMGDFSSAIKHLEAFDGKGTMIGTGAKGALGSAYMETGKTKKAIDAYEDATKDKDDIAQTPLYLFALGNAYEANKQPEDAKKAYLRIRDEYPQSSQAQDIDRYLARLGVIE
jgi:TolA-binding protein